MEGVTKKKGTSSHDCGDDGAEASWQASQRDGGRKFEVFLSFRGPDTRNGFISHLYEALKRNCISTFKDNDELETGERVEELLGYIERSNVFVPVISKGYADSKWCLKEITKSVECRRLIIPVFFGVKPSDIRNQEGPFKKAFKSYASNKKLKKEVSDWKNALREVGRTVGFNLEEVKGNEAELIKLILERIMKEVNTGLLDVGDCSIGLDSRVDEVIERLDAKIGMVGICGMGGIGKTTLAKAVYNRLRPSFKACSFLANVREASKHPNGIAGLQKQLLSDVLGSEVPVNNRDDGISLIKQRIGGRKVIVVVDDVDHKDQLDVLVGSGSGWFGGESRIIVTCRDESILNAIPEVIYRVAGLDAVQSLQLFSQHAFGQPEPPSDWKGELSKKVVPIAGGMPLCLKVFGSHFSGIKSFEEWESTLEKLKRDQHKDVHEKLKISYDSLDDNTKCIFLDLTCFHAYYKKSLAREIENLANLKECAMSIWEGSKLYPLDAIRELQRKSLIRINEDGTFEVHDQIRDMGRKIVQQKNPPSRFWEDDERLRQVLQNGKGTKNIEGIIFHGLDEQDMTQTPLKTMSFKNMVNLRILDTGSARMEGPYHHLPKSLKFLSWYRCPLKSLPIDILVENIVVLDLSDSTIEQFLGPSVTNCQPQEPNHSGKLSRLKVLILRCCNKLKSTPDFRLIPNATTLIFEWCLNLSEVHESIGHLQSLVCLNLTGCQSLKQIPNSICRLTSLEILDLRHCNKISTLPEMLGDLWSLKKLFLFRCYSLRELPEQIGRLKFLRELQLSNGKMSSIPESVGLLANLQVLEITECRLLKTIPDISNLHALRCLNLQGCFQLMDVPGLKKLRCLEYLDLSCCHALWHTNHITKGLENIEAISFHRPDQQYMTPLNTPSFRNMVELRTLGTSFVRLDNIVQLNLSGSTIEQFLGPSVTNCQLQEANHLGKLSQLKVLFLIDCKKLKCTPDFRLILNATKLIFRGCTALSEVHESIGDLQNLVCLILSGCESLEKIPDSICRLSSLEELDLKSCHKISTLPEKLGDLLSLRDLCLRGCFRLMDVPGFTKLSFLKYLDLQGCHALKDMKDMMKEVKFEEYLFLGLPRYPSTSHFKSTDEGWTGSVTVSFHHPNVPHIGKVHIEVEGQVLSFVTEVKAVRHDDSFTIFERAEREGLSASHHRRALCRGTFVHPKEGDEKEKTGMIRDGEGYRRIDVTVTVEKKKKIYFTDHTESDFLGSPFRADGLFLGNNFHMKLRKEL